MFLIPNAHKLRDMSMSNVTSSTLQKCEEAAIASKKRMLNTKFSNSKCVVRMNDSASSFDGEARTLTQKEVQSLRDTKHEVAAHALRAFSAPTP